MNRRTAARHRGRDIIPDRDFDQGDLYLDFAADTFTDDEEHDIETVKMPSARQLRHAAKQQMLNMMREEHLREVMKDKPKPGELYHVVSNGKFDFWTWIPHLLSLIGRADEFYASTWTINRSNTLEMLDLFDKGKLGAVAVVTGLYFKRRESSVYAELLAGLQARGQRFVCLENHAKVTLLANHKSRDYLCVEGSANFTANPRIEQYVICNSREVFEFHKEWMEEVLSHGSKKKTKGRGRGSAGRKAG